MDATFLIVGLITLLLVAAILVYTHVGRRSGALEDQFLQMSSAMERISSAQAELSGRLQQAQLGTDQRLEMLTKRVGDGLNQQTEKTGQTLKALNERLVVIDAAQKNISDLSSQMVGLQDILSNKQTRGTFGEIQLQDLVTSILPPSAYGFQVTLSNRKIADCLLQLPNPPGPIVIDSKFPLESYLAFREVGAEDNAKAALRAFGNDVLKHVNDIAARYIIPGETADSALMFLPSEAVYAELHASLPDVVEKSYRAKVWIVSPTTMMATLNTIRAVLKDVQMREQAGVIQAEVENMMGDVNRLDERVGHLQRHFEQAGEDMRQVRISADKVMKRGVRIREVEMGDGSPAEQLEPIAAQVESDAR